MVWRAFFLVPVALFAALPLQAAGLFNRKSNQAAQAKPKADDATALIVRTLRTDADERRRAYAAESLARFDLKQHPQAGFALIEALSRDSSQLVRGAVVESLSKMRPMTQQVAEALEQASLADSSNQVRTAAGNALMPFVQAGYRPAKREAANLAKAQPPAPRGARPQPPLERIPSPNETSEPPLADANTGAATEAAKVVAPRQPRPAEATPTIPKVNPPLTIEEPKTTVPPITPLAPKKASPAPTKPTPAKPAEGPILIPPE